MAGMERRHQRRDRRQRLAGQSGTAPAAPGATTTSAGPMFHEVPNGISGSEHHMQSQWRYY
jgi:hypothetical protein